MKTHVHPLEYAAAETHGEQLEAIHRPARNETLCWDHTCTYQDLDAAGRAANEKTALGILTREGMRQKKESRELWNRQLPGNQEQDTPVDDSAADVEAYVAAQADYRLPATLVAVPSNEYQVTGFKIHPGVYRGEGPGFTAKLTRNGRVVAHVQYNGDGGDTRVDWVDYRPDSAPHAILVPFDAVGLDPEHASSPEEADFMRWGRLFKGVWSVEFDLPWSFDGVVSVLVEEAQTAKRLNGSRTRIPVLRPQDVDTQGVVVQWGTFGGGSTPPTVDLVAKRLGADIRVWQGGAWRLASECGATV